MRRRVVIVIVGVAVAVTLAVAFSPTARVVDPTNEVIVRLCLVVAVVVATAVLTSNLPTGSKGLVVAVVAGGLLLASSAVTLNANAFAPLGIALDQAFRSSYLTKFAEHWNLVDFAYDGLPSYYPPLWFWVFGRVASVTGEPGWHMLRTGLITTAALIPLFSWAMWRRVVGPAVAIGAVLGVLAFQEWYATYEWLAAVVFVPWWLFFVLGMRPDGTEPSSDPPTRRGWIVGAVIGAALFSTYYYFFFIGAVHLVVLAVLRRREQTRSLVPERWVPRQSAMVLGGAALLSSLYWLPLLVSIAEHGLDPLQAEFYGAGFATLRFPFLTFDLIGLTLLAGLIFLVISSARSALSRALLVLLGSAYLWYVVEYVLVLSGTSATGFKTDLLVRSILAAAAGMGAAQLLLGATRGRSRLRLGMPAPPLGACAIALFILALALGQQAVTIPYVKDQRKATEPRELLADFDRATDGRPDDTLLLTDIVEFPVFRDVFVFNVWRAHYAHPAAEFSERADFLTKLSRERDPDVFALALTHNRFDEIDYVMLRPSAEGSLVYTFEDDDFPRGTKSRTLTYDLALFETRAFERSDATSFVSFRIRPRGDPLAELQTCADDVAPRCSVLTDAVERYEQYLDDDVTEAASGLR